MKGISFVILLQYSYGQKRINNLSLKVQTNETNLNN